MGGRSEEAYVPPPEFAEDDKDPLINLNLNDSTEFWLIRWPLHHPPDIDGKELSLKLRPDGQLGSFESSSGKTYDVVSYGAQDADATVFLSSGLESRIVGKISRHVSFVHYPEPDELLATKKRSAGTSLTTSTPTSKSSRLRNSKVASSHGSRPRSYVSGARETPVKRKHADEVSAGYSAQGSARSHATAASFESLENSQQVTPKKQTKRKG
ncbi:hypothetical protein RJ641_028094 [Dillenia turbinata]|uniref:Mediator-associated protein 2 n=1 Tax=Dillenia turbinata TaxID=194707 RepID=A0AAN8WBA9_9MAGN